MKILLTCPPDDQNLINVSRNGCFPPLALWRLASALIDNGVSTQNISIADGQLMTLDEIKHWLSKDFDLVGVSANIANYGTALSILEASKNYGCTTVLGGPHSSVLAKNILNCRSFVDYVVVGEGEEAITSLYYGEDPDDIPNLVYRKNGLVIKNIYKSIDTDDSLKINPELLSKNYKKYVEIFQNRYKTKFLPWIVRSQRGCLYAERGSGPCAFCKILPYKWKACSPDKYINHLLNWQKELGQLYVLDVSDSFFGDIGWLECITHKNHESASQIQLNAFCRADELKTAATFSSDVLKVHKLLVGIESGDDGILKAIGKNLKVSETVKNIKLASLNGIQLLPAFILGHPGETVESLQKTRDLALYIIEEFDIDEIAISVMVPMPGTKIEKEFRKCVPWYNIPDDFLVNLSEISETWIHYCTQVTPELIYRVQEDLRSCVKHFVSASSFKNWINT